MKLLPTEIAETQFQALGALLSRRDSGRADLWSELTAGDWVRVGLPEARGGGGADLRDLVLLAELWGRHLVSVPLLPTIVLRRWISETAVPASARLSAIHPTGLVPFGADPQMKIVRSIDATGRVGLLTSVDLVDGFAPSLPLGWTKLEAQLPPECVSELQVVAASSAVGAAAAALDATVAYVSKREAFGKAIGSFQAVKHRLANMHIDVELARTAVIWASDDPAAGTEAISIALRRAQRVIAGAIQMHGGMGFTWDMGIHLFMRHVLACTKLVTVAPPDSAASKPHSEGDQHD
jgi:alkylation response protein AidB-like acyl-CoA dehydrogenase